MVGRGVALLDAELDFLGRQEARFAIGLEDRPFLGQRSPCVGFVGGSHEWRSG